MYKCGVAVRMLQAEITHPAAKKGVRQKEYGKTCDEKSDRSIRKRDQEVTKTEKVIELLLPTSFWWHVESQRLRPASEGRTSTFPLVEAGYMTIASEPLIVYRCLADGHCPGAWALGKLPV